MVKLSVQGDRQLVGRLSAMPASVQAVLTTKVTALAIRLQGHVIQDKLHGQVLNQRSGALARSIQQEVVDDATSVYGRVFSSGDVKYAAIHEYGGVIPAHDIVPNKAEALAFLAGGEQAFAKIVHMPPVTMPERSFLRSSLADMADEIVSTLKQAVVQGARQAVQGRSA